MFFNLGGFHWETPPFSIQKKGTFAHQQHSMGAFHFGQCPGRPQLLQMATRFLGGHQR
jgi:hypothetical protein